jgi:hypothetical protein
MNRLVLALAVGILFGAVQQASAACGLLAETSPVPEPTSIVALIGLGGAGLIGWALHRRRNT